MWRRLVLLTWLVRALANVTSPLISNPGSGLGDVLRPDARSIRVAFPSYNGWFNNRVNPDYGSVDATLVRMLPPRYKDKVYKSTDSEANPLDISRQLMLGNPGNFSAAAKTAFFVYFGRHVIKEILDTSIPTCPFEFDIVPIPKDHEYRQHPGLTQWRRARDKFTPSSGTAVNNPRAQTNGVTAWIDGSSIYGTTWAWSNGLRKFEKGLLQSSAGNFPPDNVEPELPMSNIPSPVEHRLRPASLLWKLGTKEANEDPFLLSMGVMWYRWHQHLARELAVHYTTDQDIYDQARKWVIATYQHFVIDLWVPALIGEELPPYSGYNPSMNPGISQMFQASVPYYLDTMVPPIVYPRRADGDCSTVSLSPWPAGVRLCNVFWKSKEVLQTFGLEAILAGLATLPAEREDHVIIEDLRSKFYGQLEFSRRDNPALAIQAGRDHGMPSYLTVFRHFFPQHKLRQWSDLKTYWEEVDRLDPRLLDTVLPSLYGSLLHMDFFVGVLLETRVSSGRPGPILTAIIKKQMIRLRDADRFWYENMDNGLFTPAQVAYIKNLTIFDVLNATTDIAPGFIQENPFVLPLSNELSESCDRALDKINLNGKIHLAVPGLPSEEQCTAGETFDYFSGSEVSYILTFLWLFLFILVCVGLLFHLVKKKKSRVAEEFKKLHIRKQESLDDNSIICEEWQGFKAGKRQVVINLHHSSRGLRVQEITGRLIRTLDLQHVTNVEVQVGATDYHVLIHIPHDYDLILIFDTLQGQDGFINKLETFLMNLGIGRVRKEVPVKVMLKNAITRQHRQKLLEKFIRMVFAQAFKFPLDKKKDLPDGVKEIVQTEMTLRQFSECLSLPPSSSFVRAMFKLADQDKNGYINFREFIDILIIFAKGDADDKAKLMFNMYDIDRSGQLTRTDFTAMIRSLLEIANQSLSRDQIDEVISSLFSSAGIDNSCEAITFEQFNAILAEHKEELGYASLNVKIDGIPISKPPPSNLRNSLVFKAQEILTPNYSDPSSSNDQAEKKSLQGQTSQVRAEIKKPYEENRKKKYRIMVFHLLESYQMHVFWLLITTIAVWSVFIHRAYFYSVEREDSGLRRIAGYWVTVSRGSASGIMLSFSLLLLSMCRNTITILRETFLHHFVPFDAAVSFHKYMACWGLFFSVLHVIGHALNFYHLSTQPVDVVRCLFPDYYHESDDLPGFNFYTYKTITGVTGILLVLILTVMYIFAIQYSRRHIFNAFWATHSLFPLVYLLIVLHGLGNILQEPSFHVYFLGPCILFTVDRLISVSRNKMEISIVRAEMLPSDVTNLVFKRPPNFEYRSGQWVRIACRELNTQEYHPFTLSSAPNEEDLSLHIRAAGPWTINLRHMLHPDNLQDHPYPKIYLDGPFGEGHQDWFRFEVSVLVGGGIGVTPFASILKDIAFRSSLPPSRATACKKVYFIWVTRTQRQFEWLTDIIREVENRDKMGLVSVHIFITQFYHKFDLRTIMLYICERHFQKISNKSLFTGLSAITHFGRPNFVSFFDSLQNEHPGANRIGVFSCGPPPMTRSVQESCEVINKNEGAMFVHHYENF